MCPQIMRVKQSKTRLESYGQSLRGSHSPCTLWGFICSSHGQNLKKQAAGCGEKMGFTFHKVYPFFADGEQTGRVQNVCKEMMKEATTGFLGTGAEVQMERQTWI